MNSISSNIDQKHIKKDKNAAQTSDPRFVDVRNMKIINEEIRKRNREDDIKVTEKKKQGYQRNKATSGVVLDRVNFSPRNM